MDVGDGNSVLLTNLGPDESGHEEHTEVGLEPQEVFGQLTSVSFRHRHVGQKQIYLTRMLMEDLDSFVITAGFEHNVPTAL